jgi:hypothetical protein
MNTPLREQPAEPRLIQVREVLAAGCGRRASDPFGNAGAANRD